MDGGTIQLGRIVQGRFFADHHPAANKALIQGDLLHVRQEMRLTCPKIAAEEQAGGLTAGSDINAPTLQLLSELLLDGRLLRAEDTHRLAAGHAGAQGLQCAPRGDVWCNRTV